MIVSASRRTDIPAHYLPWLMGRIETGYCLVANPYDARRISRVSLEPEDVDFLVLWTRDPGPLSRRIGELDGRGLRSYVQVTLVDYPAALEPGALPLDRAIDALRELSGRVGPRRVVWRYDPVILAEGLEPGFHLRAFSRIAERLQGAVQRVVLSLLDEYAHTKSRLAAAGFPGAVFGTPRGSGPATASPPEPYPTLLAGLAAIARSRGMACLSCSEPYDLTPLGIVPGACVDAELAASIWSSAVTGSAVTGRKVSGPRGACRCAKSVDIGAYGTCPRGCVYCYANRGRGALRARGPGDEAL